MEVWHSMVNDKNTQRRDMYDVIENENTFGKSKSDGCMIDMVYGV